MNWYVAYKFSQNEIMLYRGTPKPETKPQVRDFRGIYKNTEKEIIIPAKLEEYLDCTVPLERQLHLRDFLSYCEILEKPHQL